MAAGTSLDAPIVAVTVFRDGARVQRSGTVSVEPGLRPVVIGGLPASVDPASVRVAARGPGLALLDVEVHRRYRTDPLREETARLRAEVDRCRDLVQGLDDEDTAEQARLSFLGHLSESAAARSARAGARPAANSKRPSSASRPPRCAPTIRSRSSRCRRPWRPAPLPQPRSRCPTTCAAPPGGRCTT